MDPSSFSGSLWVHLPDATMILAAVLVGVGVAVVFSGLLYMADNPRLPSYDRVKRDQEAMPSGYDLVELKAPRLAGMALRILGLLTRTPVVGRLVCRHLYNNNKMIEVRRVAAFIPDQPLYYPFVDPPPTAVPSDAISQEQLVEFATSKSQPLASGFRHWTISDYTSRYASGQLSPLQVVRAVLLAVDESERGEKPLRIFVEMHDDEILSQAQASAERYARGQPLGVLDGVPVAVKDEIDIKGFKLFAGTSFLGNDVGVALEDSLPVARLREQGAIILGKTNMHEVGSGVTGFNMNYGTPRNPYNLDHYTGGSSSGSAVAVSSGIVPLAVGLDAGGSVRIPAGMCGVVGLKATFLRVPPMASDCPSMAHVGPITGCVRDAAVAYAVMSGSHESVPRSLLLPAPSFASFNQIDSLRGLKIGFFRAHTDHASAEVSSATYEALQKLEALGAELVEIELDFLQAIHFAHSLTIATELALHLDAFYSKFNLVSPEVQILLSFARNFTATDFLAAQRVRAFALRQLQDRVYSRVDVFLCPTTAITAPVIPKDALSYGELDSEVLGRIMRFTVYANFVGNPAIAVPVGYDSHGLPMSVQVQASHYREDIMLRVAHAIEEAYVTEQREPHAYFSILEKALNQPKA